MTLVYVLIKVAHAYMKNVQLISNIEGVFKLDVHSCDITKEQMYIQTYSTTKAFL
jgi:hypothetical protein